MLSVGCESDLDTMEGMYRKALIIGKFMPLHKGHKSLVEFAKSRAESVDMLVTAHEGESIPLHLREAWARDTFANDNRVAVYGYLYDVAELNESSESDLKSSHEWADYLMKVHSPMKDVDVIIGSERYVQYMADYLRIDYIIYDEKRENLKISATQIKSDIIRYWDYLVPAVKRHYVTHICICGSESTGKSTTCKRLEEQYGFVTMIPEIGRCLVGKSELCSMEVLQKIYDIHYRLLKAVHDDPPTPIILWDTDSITTLSYFTFIFRYVPLVQIKGYVDESEYTEQDLYREVIKADKYFFFESNIDFHDDGTRYSESEARLLSINHLQAYAFFGIVPEIVTTDERFQVVEQYILNKKNELIKAFSERK